MFSFGFCAETFFQGEDGAVTVYLPVSQFRGSIRTLGTCWMMRNASIHPGPKSAHLDVSRSSSAGRRSALFSQVVLICRLKWGGVDPQQAFPAALTAPPLRPPRQSGVRHRLAGGPRRGGRPAGLLLLLRRPPAPLAGPDCPRRRVGPLRLRGRSAVGPAVLSVQESHWSD